MPLHHEIMSEAERGQPSGLDTPPELAGDANMKSTCAVDGCSRGTSAKGFCKAHYTRWKRTGDPGSAEIWDKRPRQCKVEGCDTVARSLGMCNAHHIRWSKYGDPAADRYWRENSPRWVDREHLTYDAAHDRVKRYRGAAALHDCSCGEVAQDWAYLHNDPEPLLDEKGRPFSDDIERYAPMCRSCHKAFDWENKRQREAI